jgi:hypothetical protein
MWKDRMVGDVSQVTAEPPYHARLHRENEKVLDTLRVQDLDHHVGCANHERADGLADQSDQAKVREIDETSGADIGLTRQNDAETAVIQDELSKILAENQMVLDEFGVNQAESAGTAPASLEKSTADMTALQQPAGDQAQTQAAANREEKTELNQPPVWRPARMDFRKK